MSGDKQQRFWNRVARRYAARQIKDVAAYEAMLADVASRLTPSDRVLELGCGTGGTAIRLAPGVRHWTATDFSARMIEIAKGKPAADNLSFVQVEAENAFNGAPFDAVCAFNVLHLLDDPDAVLAGIHDSLKPGGLLISKTWCFGDLGRRLRGLFALLRTVGLFPAAHGFTREDVGRALEGAGFEIVDERVFGKHQQNPYIVARRRFS
jgi:SAM-dependent methyltransferase